MVFDKIFNYKYNSWNQLEESIESIDTAKGKGIAFEQFVFAYFQYYKDIYQISKLYMGSMIPNEIKKKIRLEKRDSGVDGIIVKEDGAIVAYQAKFRSDRLAPSYDELTSFWAESEHADERCIIANCYELPIQAYKKKNQFTILRDELNSLDESFFEWLHSFSTTGEQTVSRSKYPRNPHQVKMISDVIEGFKTEKRGKLLAACGSGKTLAALWIKEDLKAKYTLFVAPNLSLIKQTLESWMPQSKSPFAYLCVCSDSTVAENTRHLENDDLQVDASYIGIPVTTDSDKISSFLQSETAKDKVIFSTYQSLDAIVLSVQKLQAFTFDITFFDEAHRTAGNKDTQMFIIGMNNTYLPSRLRLFMTATERFVNPRIVGRAHQYNYEIFSMDNYEQYGPTFTSLPFRAAIEQKIISDYKIVLCCMKEGELKNIIENDFIISIGDREVDSQNLFKQVLLAKTMKDIGIHKVISYHRDIESAKQFISSTNSTDLKEIIANIIDDTLESDIYCDHINGTMPAGKRKEKFDEFIAAPFGVISNARCLTEGVDVPVIDAVYFADPKNSVIDIIQAVGRSLRKVESNPDKVSYIIIPMIISDDIQNFEDIDAEEFSTLHTVIQALRDQDRILADYIDKLNLKLAKGEKPTAKENEDPTLIIEVSENVEIDDIANKILLRVAEVNRDPANISREFIFEPKSRTSGVERGSFTTVGDYNLDSYWQSCVIATLGKYESLEIGLPRTAITIDHNNVSHAVKIGALIEKEQKFYPTDIGKRLYECSSFEMAVPIFQEQLLKFYKLSPIVRVPYFPYRYAFNLLSIVGKMSKFEFAYSMYIAKDLGERGITEAYEKILYLRETYPRIETLNASNKEIVLAALNDKFDATLKLLDIWSSRTTLYNQFNYLKKHLLLWSDIFLPNTPEICLKDGAQSKITQLLDNTSEIIRCPMDKLTLLFTNYQNWI
ncbi:MAG: DEAD/DEAH box helicase family protein [Clostridia bacterium]